VLLLDLWVSGEDILAEDDQVMPRKTPGGTKGQGVEFHTFVLRRFSRQLLAPPDGDRGHNDPQRNCVDGIPECFLSCCHTSGTENNQGSGRAYVHLLGQQYTLRVCIDLSDQNPHGRHGRGKRDKVREPKCTVRSSSAQVIDHR
jgi:hypothetical protein